jgi:hypothetical protein
MELIPQKAPDPKPVFQPPTNRPAVPKPEEWGTIEPLGIVHVPPFPVGVLPEVLADFVAAEAEATQTPPDLAAMLCLAVCAAAVAKKIEVCVRDDWLEPVNLFTVTVLEPGNRKSAVFSHATAPLREFEAQSVEQERPELARQQDRRRQRERQMKVLEEKAAKKGDTAAGADDGARHPADRAGGPAGEQRVSRPRAPGTFSILAA